MRRVALLTIVPVLAIIGTACRHDGRTLRPARPDQNVSISTSSAPSDTSATTDAPTSLPTDSSEASTTGG